MKTSESVDKLYAALVKAQGAMEGAEKTGVNPHFHSKYADLASVWNACRKPMADNGIAAFQGVSHDNGTALLKTRICHSSGQWMEDGGIPLLLDKQNMQGMGSAQTYARRYGLMAALGIAPEDDDGNAAVKSDKPAGQPVTVKRGTKKAAPPRVDMPDAPGLITVPKPNGEDMDSVWRAWASTFKGAVDSAANLEALNAWAKENDAPLKNLGAHSETALQFLEDRLAEKRGTFAQDPAEDPNDPLYIPASQRRTDEPILDKAGIEVDPRG
jgi:hypothetical protein